MLETALPIRAIRETRCCVVWRTALYHIELRLAKLWQMGIDRMGSAMTARCRKIRPYRSVSINYFCRLCRPLEETFDLRDMVKLGRAMNPNLENSQTLAPRKDAGSAAPEPLQPPAVAYAYFGQFIDHDLIRDNTELAAAGTMEPWETVNAAGGRLDLHHIYGDGPGSKQHGSLYMRDKASFRLGKVSTNGEACGLPNGEAFDLPLDKCGCPISADERNTDNIILRQISVLFMKLHNIAVQHLKEEGEMNAKRLFRKARKRVIEQYQWLVRHNFLEHILCNSVYSTLSFRNLQIDWKRGKFAIPVEFAQGAFRFGHSMVRDFYRLNCEAFEVPLATIFGNEQKQGPLCPKMAIDWRSFVIGSDSPAKVIDTLLTPALFALPSTQVCHHRVPESKSFPQPPELAVRTLQRGRATRLPTGQQVAEYFCIPPLRRSCSPGPSKRDPWAKLEELGLLDRIPLWYYVLLESEVNEKGFRLGVLGSRLVGEVILGALRNDKDSYVCQHGKEWAPKPWRLGEKTIPIGTLADIAVVTHLI